MAVRDRLEELESRGAIDDVETVVRGRTIELDPTTEDGDSLLRTYQRFRGWAAENDRDLAPAFRVRESTTIGTEGSYPVVSVPVVCIAVYDGERLLAVYPHSDGDETMTVADGLAALADGRLTKRRPEQRPNEV